MKKLLSLVTLMFVLTQSAHAMHKEYDTNYVGGDYRMVKYVGATDCSYICESEFRCAGYTWVPKGAHPIFPYKLFSTCWLKDRISGPIYLRDAISGIK